MWKDLKALVVRKRWRDSKPIKAVTFTPESSFQLKSQSYYVQIVQRKLFMDSVQKCPQIIPD